MSCKIITVNHVLLFRVFVKFGGAGAGISPSSALDSVQWVEQQVRGCGC
jgi:hypothetical protein